MTTDNFCFYLQNRLIQTSQTGGQQYSDTSPFRIPCLYHPKVFEDDRALEYVDGVAVHWYTDRWFPFPEALEIVHREYPDKFILYTEACTGLT
jgi:hypothetical protein